MAVDLAEPRGPDVRTRLRTLWNVLDVRGAVVRRQDIEALTDDVVLALCEHEAARIRALREGDAAGWHPRHRGQSETAADVIPSTPVLPWVRRGGESSGLRRCTAGARDQRKPDTANEGKHQSWQR
jgi:hypothetical protein